MNDKNKNKGKSSKFSQHLMLMGIENPNNLTVEDVLAEKKQIDSIEVPELVLSDPKLGSAKLAQKKSRFEGLFSIWGGFGALAVACAVLFMVYLPFEREPVTDDDSVWRSKGNGIIEVFYQKAGKVEKFGTNTKLENGMKIQVRLLASTQTTGFFGIVNKNQDLLSDIDDIMTEKLQLDPSNRDFFSSTVELVGENEGETVVVVTCQSKYFDQLEAVAQRTLVVGLFGKDSASLSVEPCGVTRIRLR